MHFWVDKSMFVHFVRLYSPMQNPNNTILHKEQYKQEHRKEKIQTNDIFKNILTREQKKNRTPYFTCTFHFPEFTFQQFEMKKNTPAFIQCNEFSVNGVFSISVVDDAFSSYKRYSYRNCHVYTRIFFLILFAFSILNG